VEPVADLLARLERGELGNAEAVVAYVAGADLDVPDAELSAARRRALLLLAAGGDPHRELDVDDRAVKSLAVDLWSEQRREHLLRGLDALALIARELPHVRETVLALARDPDLAWRLYALALLAEELGDSSSE
jgi:hypothetical protein